MHGPETDEPWPRPLLAWGIVAALFIAYIFSFIDRMIIGLLVEPIKADLGLTDIQISLLQGLAFALFYSVAGIPIGRLIDRMPRMRIIAAGIALWSLATAACAAVGNFAQFFVARIAVGVGEATLSPAAYSIISDSFPRQRLGLAMGVYGLGAATGAGLAFLIGAVVISLVANAEEILVPGLGPLRAWQVAFLVAGLPGLPLALLFLLLPEPRRRGLAKGAMHVAVPMKEVIAFARSESALLWSMFLAVGLINFAVMGAVSWLPAMFMRVHGLDIATAGYLAGGGMILGGLIGLIGGGLIADRMAGGAPKGRLKLAAIATCVGVIGAIGFPLAPTALMAMPFFILFFISAAVATGVAPAVLQQVTPNPMRATLSATYIFVVNIIGLAFGPTAVAVVGDVFFPYPEGIAMAILAVCPLAYAGAAILFIRATMHARISSERAISGAAMPQNG